MDPDVSKYWIAKGNLDFGEDETTDDEYITASCGVLTSQVTLGSKCRTWQPGQVELPPT